MQSAAGHTDDRTLTAQVDAQHPRTGTALADGRGDSLDWRASAERWLSAPDANDFTAGSDAASQARVALLGLLGQHGGFDFLLALADEILRVDNDRAVAASVGVLSRALARGGELSELRLPPRDSLELALGAGFAPLLPAAAAELGRRVALRYFRPLLLEFDDSVDKNLGEIAAEGGVRPVAAPVGVRAIGDRQADLQLALVEQLVSDTSSRAVALSLSAVARLGDGGRGSAARERLIERTVERLAHLAQLARSTETQLVFEVDQYRDLDLTVAVAARLLDHPENDHLSIALTLPLDYAESFTALQRVVALAEDRRARGATPVTIRFARADEVPIERETARERRWPTRAIDNTSAVFANLQHMLDWLLDRQRLASVGVILASDRVHEHAFASRLARSRGVLRSLEHEFRYGTAPAVAAAVKRSVGGIRLRIAVVRPHGEARAADYLVNRLRALHTQRSDHDGANVADAPLAQRGAVLTSSAVTAPTVPEPRRVGDADPFSAEGRAWFDAVADRVRGLVREGPPDAPAGNAASITAQLDRAAAAAASWAERRGETRAVVLRSVAEAFTHARTELVSLAMVETGMTVADTDHEVTEAIDLALSLAESAESLGHVANAEFVPARLVLAMAPRTSPLSVPAYQLLSALAAGSAVAMKPAPQNWRSVAALVATIIDGGVPQELIALLPPIENDDVDEVLRHPLVDRVLVTGSRHVAKRLRTRRPEVPVLATTGGRNSIIVSESANVERAVADVVESAFHNAGQSPQSPGTVIVVGEHERFVSLLTDAVASLSSESPQGLATVVGALSRPAQGAVADSLTVLGAGESWLVQPRRLDAEGRLFTPGLVDGGRPENPRQLAERRAPVLTIVRVESFDHALELQNAVGFGLTAGLQSTDSEELALWLDAAQAGGLAANRPVTGALPSRHPVAGWGRSSIGVVRAPGSRLQLDELGAWRRRDPEPDESVDLVGVGESVAQLITAAQSGLSFDEFDWVRSAARDDELEWRREFGSERELSVDGAQLSPVLYATRYRPLATTVRLADGASFAEFVRVLAAATRVHAPVAVSCAAPLPDSLIRFFRSSDSPIAEVVIESDARWHARVHAGDLATTRIRLVGSDSTALDRVIARHAAVAAITGPVTASGRVELAHFLTEQSVQLRATLPTDAARRLP